MIEKKTEQLIKSFLALSDESEMEAFLRDLMTVGEIEEFSNRLETASLLDQGEAYLDIEEKLGVSSTTIARVSKCLTGPEAGYRSVLSKLHHKTDPN